MKSLIEQLYHGKIHPAEQAISNDPQYQQLLDKTSESIELWRGRLSEEGFNELKELLDLYA